MYTIHLTKSRKYRVTFKVNSRGSHGKIEKNGLNNWNICKSLNWTEPGARNSKRSLLSCQTRTLLMPRGNHLQFGKRQARYEGYTIGESLLVIG